MSADAGLRVVVVGASLGGLDAFGTISSQLPADFAAAVVFVQHRRPGPLSALADILARHSALPVTEPDSHDPLERGRVYLAPSDYHLMIDNGRFELSCDGVVKWARPSIDVLFEAAAREYGARVAGVLLTGASEDGAAGLETIAKAGGLTIVQDPDTAESPIAVRAALARFKPDAVLPIPAIAGALEAWVSAPMETR